MPPVGSAGPLLFGLLAEHPGSPPEPSSVSEPDGEPDLPPPTRMELEASSGPVLTGTAGTGLDGSDFLGTALVEKGFDGTGSGFVGTGLVGIEPGFVGTWIVGAQFAGT